MRACSCISIPKSVSICTLVLENAPAAPSACARVRKGNRMKRRETPRAPAHPQLSAPPSLPIIYHTYIILYI
jgi:hypothetical protein